jgi:hypothetical protein
MKIEEEPTISTVATGLQQSPVPSIITPITVSPLEDEVLEKKESLSPRTNAENGA